MPILRTRVPIAPITELRLPRLELELPAVRVVSAVATMKLTNTIWRSLNPVKPKEGETHEQTT